MKTVVALFSKTDTIVRPWLNAGYRAVIVDLQHPEGETTDDNLVRIGADGAARVQRVPADDQIISEHIDGAAPAEAHVLLVLTMAICLVIIIASIAQRLP